MTSGSLAGRLSGKLSGSLAVSGGEVIDTTVQDTLSGLVDAWDSRYGVETTDGAVTSWTSRVLDLVLEPDAEGNRPLYSISPELKGRRAVVSTTTVSSSADRFLRMQADHGSDLVASGARPYTYWIGTIDAFLSGSRWIVSLMNSGSTASVVNFRIPDETSVQLRVNQSASLVANYSTTDTGPHFWEMVIEENAGNEIVLYRDGAEVGRDETGAVTSSAVRRVNVATLTGGSVIDASHAAFGFCTAEPSAGERAALLAWSQLVWGTP